MTRRSTGIASGLASLAVLALLLVGPPLVLATQVGWPLPTSVPDVAAVEQGLRSGISDDVVLGALAVLGWLTWFQVAVAVLAEAAAVVRGRPSMQLPMLPGVQAFAGRLVASAAMMTATLSPGAAMAATPPIPVAATQYVPPPVAVPPPVWMTEAAVAAPAVVESGAAASAAATVTVERHDSYWAIAERTLGDGFRWREIRDHNVGRTMNTGHVITAGSDLVEPGWVLELPAGAATPTPPPAPATPGVGEMAEIVVEYGDSFWSLAEEQLEATTGRPPTDTETAPYWRDMIDANADRLVVPSDPNFLYPGQTLCVPTLDGAPAVGGPATEAAETPPPAPEQADPAPESETVPDSPQPDASAPPVEDDRADTSERSPTARSTEVEGSDTDAAETSAAVAAIGVVSAAFAVGATRAIRRRRKVAMRSGRTDAPAPSDRARALHRDLLVAADEDAVDALRRHLGNLAHAVSASGVTSRPLVVQHGPDHLEVLLDHPCSDPPPGWTADADGAIWSLAHDDPHTSPEDPICATPLLVSLGRPDDSGQLYLDLEALNLVALTGDRDEAEALARSILIELAVTPLADTLEVLVVGDLVPAEVRDLDHVTIAAEWDDVIDDLTAWAVQSDEAISENGWPNAFAGRGADPFHDALAPVVVIAHVPPPAELVETLSSHPLATAAIVAVGDVEGATKIECTPDALGIADLGLTCVPVTLDTNDVDAIIDLVEPPMVEADDVPDEPFAPPTVLVEPNADGPEPDLEEREYDILVRVLGDIRVEGGEPLTAKQTAVVTYVALHESVSADRLEDAVWAGPVTSRRKRLANTMSECRALIGRRHLPPATDGRYRTGPGVVTDLELFDLRTKRAAGQLPEGAVETLRSALDLVTGPPFTYRTADRSSFAWVDLENWTSTWELKVAAVARRCTEMLLQRERNEDAVAVALHALHVVPTDARLVEALMSAYAAAGDRVAALRVYGDHVTALAALGLDEVQYSTTEALHKLMADQQLP